MLSRTALNSGDSALTSSRTAQRASTPDIVSDTGLHAFTALPRIINVIGRVSPCITQWPPDEPPARAACLCDHAQS